MNTSGNFAATMRRQVMKGKGKPKMMKGREAAGRMEHAVDRMPPGMRMGKKPKGKGKK